MAKFETRLSLASLDELIKRLETKKKNYPKVAMRTADRLADEMLNSVVNVSSPHGRKPYADTEKISAKLEGNTAVAGIKNETEKAYFNEFGTGIVGSQNPHIAEQLAKEGYTYDKNSYGEAGWWYPTNQEDSNPTKKYVDNEEYQGWIAWTRGLPAQKAFWEALQKAQELFPEVVLEELQRGE